MAIPYYNITLSITNPEQSNTWDDTMKCVFSNSNFWSNEDANIEPMSSSNIQQYIEAYQTKLQRIAGSRVTAEVGRFYGDNALTTFSGEKESESRFLLNPSGIGSFWVGSSYASSNVDRVHDLGLANFMGSIIVMINSSPYYSAVTGVRPVIFIDIS